MALSLVYYYGILLRIAIYLLPLFSFIAAGYVRFGSVLLPHRTTVVMDNYLILLLVTQFAWIVAANYYKLSTVTNLFWEYTGIRAAIYACCATFLSQNVLLVFAKQLVISRLFVILSTGLLLVSTVAVRALFRIWLSQGGLPRKSERILVIGTDQYARRAVSLLNRVPFLRCDIRGYVRLAGQAVMVKGAPIMTPADSAEIEALDFDEVVVAIPAERYMQASSFVDSLQNLGKPIRAILDLGPRLSIRERLFQVGRLQVMSLAIFPIESFAYTVLKRAFDWVFATLALIVLSPLMLTIAVLVKLTSPGPVVFRQTRIGRHGKLFTLLKFRTMQCGSIAEADTLWTTKSDPRCTPVGAILRKFSLDELPQLWNVIRGEMSVVGPRPERPHFVAKFRSNIRKYNTRHCCEVGITGWAQVNGLRGDTSISDRLRYDLYYLRNWSMALDLRIIVRTVLTVLRDQNGY